jgi:hypothetical protein
VDEEIANLAEDFVGHAEQPRFDLIPLHDDDFEPEGTRKENNNEKKKLVKRLKLKTMMRAMVREMPLEEGIQDEEGRTKDKEERKWYKKKKRGEREQSLKLNVRTGWS